MPIEAEGRTMRAHIFSNHSRKAALSVPIGMASQPIALRVGSSSNHMPLMRIEGGDIAEKEGNGSLERAISDKGRVFAWVNQHDFPASIAVGFVQGGGDDETH